MPSANLNAPDGAPLPRTDPAAAPDLLLLHGALGAAAQLEALAALLAPRYRVHRLDFEGHGLAAGRGRPFRIEHFAENVRDYLDQAGIARAAVFGYSMGGYVGLYLARHAPERVAAVVTLGTKFHWDAATAERETRQLDPAKIRAKVPHFAQALAERHSAAGWESVLAETAGLLHGLGAHNVLGAGDYPALDLPVRLMLGDRDTTVTVEETLAVYRALPRGELAVLPGTPHPLEKVAPGRLAQLLEEFLDQVPVR